MKVNPNPEDIQLTPFHARIHSPFRGGYRRSASRFHALLFRVCPILLLALPLALAWPGPGTASAAEREFTLMETIRAALAANLEIKIRKEATQAADAMRKSRRADFLPTFSAGYEYRRFEDPADERLSSERHTLVGSVAQPVFTGFSILNRYRIAALGVDVARLSEEIARQDIILDAKRAFFNILKAQKLVSVAQQAVVQLDAHKEVARKFHKVGLTPINDFLRAEVELANARQELITAENNLEIARSNFNVLLRRPINAPVSLEDALYFVSFDKDIDTCLAIAREKREEIRVANMEVAVAEREKDVTAGDYFPNVEVRGNVYQRGDDWKLDGGPGIEDDSTWEVSAVASWNFWEWGRTHYAVNAERSRLTQAKYEFAQVVDAVTLQVKRAYLNTRESERNIVTVQKAVEQAQESFRISEERYRNQVSTTTDVLDSQTQLTRTMSNYYTALYNFKISKAELYRAMGVEVVE